MHFDSENCICTDNGQGQTLTGVWQFMDKNTTMCFNLKKGSDRGTHVVGIKGYLYDTDFDVGKTVLIFTTC